MPARVGNDEEICLAGWKVELGKPGERFMLLAKVTFSKHQNQNGKPERVGKDEEVGRSVRKNRVMKDKNLQKGWSDKAKIKNVKPQGIILRGNRQDRLEKQTHKNRWDELQSCK